MEWVRPRVYLIAKTEIALSGVVNWLQSLGVSSETRRKFHMDAERYGNCASLVQFAGRRCYKSFEVGLNPNVTKVRDDLPDYIDNILKVGHGSVLEHCSWTFAFENVSRVFTGEMNRHRAGVAISEGSMRYIRFDNIPICETPCLRINDGMTEAEVAQLVTTRAHITGAVTAAEKQYQELQKVWGESLKPESKFKGKKEVTSMLRRIVPMGVATGGVWTLNARALRHICELRTTEHAEEEIREVAGMILEILIASEPLLFGDFAKDEEGFWKAKYHKI
jgi:thymidylate synthase (FAD)